MQEHEAIRARQIEANAARATLAISIDPRTPDIAAEVVYRGEVYGPLADDRTTLPASFRIAEFGLGEEARVVVVDPCFWSSESPLEYEIALTPKSADGDGQTLRRRIRLRPRNEMNG